MKKLMLMGNALMFIMLTPSIFVERQQRCKRRGINSTIQKTLVLYFMVVSFSNMSHALVAVRFSFTTLPTSEWYRLQMGPNDYDNETDADFSNENEGDSKRRESRNQPRARTKKSNSSTYSSLLPPPAIGKATNRRRWESIDTKGGQGSSTSSRERRTSWSSNASTKNDAPYKADNITKKSPRLLVRPGRPPSEARRYKPKSRTVNNNKATSTSSIVGDETPDLPEWGALFSSPSQYDAYSDFPSMTPTAFPTTAIEGVLPVSELFYRSTQSISSVDEDEDEDENESDRDSRARKRRRAKSYKNTETESELGDDEELPFSAEQSDTLSTPGNKIQIRRNKVMSSSSLLDQIATGIGVGMDGNRVPSEAVRRELKSMARQEQAEQRQIDRRRRQQSTQKTKSDTMDKDNDDGKSSTDSPSKSTKTNKKRIRTRKGDRVSGRKMVRRGMEMLVGGEPINADPPQRAVELNYFNKHPRLWNRAITLNSPDFGPLLNMHSAGKISKKEVGLYCENFVHNAQKWNICPADLKAIVSENELIIRNNNAVAEHASAVDTNVSGKTDLDIKSAFKSSLAAEGIGVGINEGIIQDEDGRRLIFNPRELEPPKGFGISTSKKYVKKKRDSRGVASGIASNNPLRSYPNKGDDIKKDLALENVSDDSKLMFTLGGELKFSLGITKAELESGGEFGKAFRRVLREGIALSMHADEMGFDVAIAKVVITDVEGESSDVVVRFSLEPREAMEMGEAEKIAKDVNGALASAMDDGKMAIALAQVASEEKSWSSKTRNRIVEEFLFDTEDDEEEKEFEEAVEDDDREEDEVNSSSDDDSKDDQDELYDGPFGMAGDPTYEKDDLWLGGGNGGVFFDYSESNTMNSPYKGSLGPYLIDAAAQRARQNQPKVIAIGDVHGCIDELQSLLRKCDYHPGDTVVFLGDLVCKGPDSLSVVQMAREIGAIGVRGNHDFEVVRWHQAIKSGADPPVIGSEHYYVASALSTADLKWMYTLPWFISSSHLNALFVHAGFVSGIRLAKQNPRLMMNMRSILPDGTVTSKFFNNWPWARLWDGPQTVFFGHDADRGLQQYEHAIGLDTGCVYGGKLTACILPERRLVSVNAKREYFQYRRKHFD